MPSGQAKAGWRERKEQYLHQLQELTPGDAALLVSCSDKLHNAQAIAADLESHGLTLWGRFPGKTTDDHLWYYGSLADTFADVLRGPLSDRLRATVTAMAATHHRLTAEAATAG